MKRIILKNAPSILFGFIFTFFIAWIYISDTPQIERVVTTINNAAYDLILRTTLNELPPINNNNIGIVAIDDKSIAEQGRWPWSRKKIMQLVAKLKELGATVVAFDILFSEPEKNIISRIITELAHIPGQEQRNLQLTLEKFIPYFQNDAFFANLLSKGDYVLGMAFKPYTEITEGQLPPPLLTQEDNQTKALPIPVMQGYLSNIPILQRAAKYAGFINSSPDPDGTLRETNLLLAYKGGIYPSLALEAIRLFLLADKIQLVTSSYGGKKILEGVQLDQLIIPTDETGSMLIPFRVGPYAYPYFSASDVLLNRTAQADIAGKLIFIGATATGLGDLKPSALENNYPGVEVHATIASAILDQYFPSKPVWGRGLEFVLILLLGLLGAIIFPFLNALWLALIFILVFIAWFFATMWLWINYSIVMISLFPLLTVLVLAFVNMVNSYLSASYQRKEIKSIFGQYVPEQHIDTILKSSNEALLSGESKELTVLFADIRDFTAISETMSANQLKMQLNEYLTVMTDVIFKLGGTIDKYVGDMIMAFWNAPLTEEKHAQKAILASLEMQKQLQLVNESFAKMNLPSIQICIGVNTGVMNIGDMGSIYRRAYTAIGDAVNLASRLESLCRLYDVKIMVGEDTYKQTKNYFCYMRVDKVRVKGKTHAVTIYTPIGLSGEVTAKQLEEIELFHQGLNYYLKQEWDEAEKIFRDLAKTNEKKRLFSLYLERIQAFRQNPPPQKWDGTYIYTVKH